MVPRLVIHLLQRLDILSLQGREEVGDLRRLRAGTQIQSAEISSNCTTNDSNPWKKCIEEAKSGD